jgi:predicted transcriptional regulator
LKHEKRHRLQLYYDILRAIEEDAFLNGDARPTRIQHYSRLSYDKMVNHFAEMEGKGMIQRTPEGLLTITAKGRKFVEQYDELITLIESVGL